MQMQKGKLWKIVLVLSAMVFSFCLVSQYGMMFNFIKAIPVIGLIVSYNFPPSDYYVPRLDTPLDPHAEGMKFTCHYTGRYEIDVRGGKASSLDESGFGIGVRVRNSSGETIYSGLQSNAVAFASYDRTTDETYFRFCYFVLDLPNDLPLDEPLYLSYDCFGQYESFVTANPQARIVIQKFSDK